jgi:RNA polymerase-associated protein RTF1
MDMPSNPFYTDQYVILAHGKAEKEWPFTHCSDSKFTEAELEDWKKTMQTEGLRMITRKECSTKCEKINALINHRFTGDELNAKLDKQRKYRHLLNPSVSKPSIVKQTTSNDQQERLRIRNEKNRRQNTEDVRKALVEQKNRQRAAARAKAKADVVAKENSLAVPKNEFDGLFRG